MSYGARIHKFISDEIKSKKCDIIISHDFITYKVKDIDDNYVMLEAVNEPHITMHINLNQMPFMVLKKVYK